MSQTDDSVTGVGAVGRGLTRRGALACLTGFAVAGLSHRLAGPALGHSPNKFFQGALPYDFSALEGFLSAESLENHYRHHHRPLVDQANGLLDEITAVRSAGHFDALPELQKRLTMAASGHVLHSIHWSSMSPHGGGDPTGDVGAHIVEHFGSAEGFRRNFAALANADPACGWTVAVWEPLSSRILITRLDDDAGPFLAGAIPLLALDLHEHAYHPDYGHRRGDYVDKFLDLLDWDFLAVQLKRAH